MTLQEYIAKYETTPITFPSEAEFRQFVDTPHPNQEWKDDIVEYYKHPDYKTARLVVLKWIHHREELQH